jgi:hypothetical protein
MSDPNVLGGRAKALNLQGLPEQWSEVASCKWIAKLLDSEDKERRRRSLEWRLKDAHIGQF